jgi:hypothetical protein
MYTDCPAPPLQSVFTGIAHHFERFIAQARIRRLRDKCARAEARMTIILASQ